MFYVYILQSQKDKSYYTGMTQDLKQRLSDHNSGSAKYSSSKRPYTLVWYSAFLDKTKALQFERYLKSGSGFAFRNKHFL
jgi:predicted GIY-YIG superfamily endonuclease